jgi:hypothetical protein
MFLSCIETLTRLNSLDSRQRKKQHTERLEDEKKQYTELIGQMEQEMDHLKVQMEQLLREKQQYSDYIETLSLEKEEMIRAHTIETGELRKKVAVLTNHVQTLEGATMPAVPVARPNQAFPGSFGEMDGITMDGSWENMPLFGDFAPVEQAPEVKQEVQLVPIKPADTMSSDVIEKPAQNGGLLFMLFLVGAFVLSSRSTPTLPRVSEDVRAASATILESVLKDAGVVQPSSALDVAAAQPSGSWRPAMPMPGSAMEGVVAPSMLADMTDSLTQPTSDQANEQLFSLSAAQYNGVVGSQDCMPLGDDRSAGRRNLAEALANMRRADDANNKHSIADVYTRSLLLEQIPADVVRNFFRLFADRNNQHNNDDSDM